MKFLKFLLIIFLLLIFVGIGGVLFQNQIIFHMTKTKNSEFENVKYSIRENELKFDNFVLNGKNLGKGRAKVSLEISGLFGAIPKLKLSEMKLEDLDLNVVYNAPNSVVDGFMEKIDAPLANKKIEKTTEQYVSETVKEMKNINAGVDNFINNKIKENIETTNKLKTDYAKLTDLKSRAQKLNELNKEIKPLAKLITEESNRVEKIVSDIEVERNLMLDNMAEELTKLDKVVSLNNVENINSYIFLDRAKVIVAPLNKALKTVNLINEIKDLPLTITDIAVNDGKIKITNLNGEKTAVSGNIVLEDGIVAKVQGKENGYEINYIKDDITVSSLSEINSKIDTTVTYRKSDLLEGKVVNLISNLIFEKNNLTNSNKTVLTDEEKKLLAEKINNLETVKYEELIKNYTEQTNTIDSLIKETYNQIAKLNSLQRELLLLNTIISVNQQSDQTSQDDTDTAGTINLSENLNTNGKTGNNTGAAAENIKGIINQIFDKK